MNNGIRMIVGLGNIGQEYQDTRHNAGFWFVDRLASKSNISLQLEKKFFAEVGKGKCQGDELILVKPTTFMNLSGKAVLAVANFFKITPQQILVVHDELDFEPGVAKLKFSGGNGGHNGLKDISRVIGQEYWRLRIGIGHPGHSSMVHSYVLKRSPIDDQISIDNAIEKSLLVLDDLMRGDFAVAQKSLHTASK